MTTLVRLDWMRRKIHGVSAMATRPAEEVLESARSSCPLWFAATRQHAHAFSNHSMPVPPCDDRNCAALRGRRADRVAAVAVRLVVAVVDAMAEMARPVVGGDTTSSAGIAGGCLGAAKGMMNGGRKGMLQVVIQQ